MLPVSCRLTQPYPDEMPAAADPHLAARLLPLCADALDRVSHYTCLALRTEQTQPACSALFADAAETALLHFRLLGRLILALGANPAIRRRPAAPVRPDLPVRPIGRLLEAEHRRSRQTAEAIGRLLGRCRDPAARGILQRLQQDESCFADGLARILRQ